MRRVVGFYLLACAISWVIWLPLVAFARGWTETPASPYLHLVGGIGPALAAIVVATHARDRSLRRLVARVLHVPWRWLVIAVGGPIALYVAAGLVVSLAGGEVQWSAIGSTPEFPALGIAAFVLANLVCYGVGEELGWRGFALPQLQRSMSATCASLIIGVAWAAWHLPLFAFTGMSAMGLAAVVGWLASMVAGSFLMTSLFNESGGSVLAVALFHGVLDVLMTSPVGSLQSVMGALVTVAGLTIPFRFGRADLSPRPRTVG